MPDTEKNPESVVEYPPMRIAPLSPLQVYPLYEHELNQLAKGSLLPLIITLSIFLFSLSGSLIGSMLPSILNPPYSNWILAVFIIGLVCFSEAIALLLIWWFKYKSNEKFVNEIKKRLLPPKAT